MTLTQVRDRYAKRHRDLPGVLRANYARIAHRIPATPSCPTSAAASWAPGSPTSTRSRRRPCSTRRPSSIPISRALLPGRLRFILSLRAVGEGHLSSVEFRTGVLGPAGELRIDEPGPHIERGRTLADVVRPCGVRGRARGPGHRSTSPPRSSSPGSLRGSATTSWRRRSRTSPVSDSPAPPRPAPPTWRGASPRPATRSSSRRRRPSPNVCCGRRVRRSRTASRTPASCASRTTASTGRPTPRSTVRRSPRS